MGNTISENKKPVDFQNIIDTIATYYILTMDFKNLSKLSEKEHCDKMLVLTSDIIGKYFTLQQIAFLEERVTNGQPINSMEKDKVIFMTKEQLENLDINVNKKQRVCLGIAKFYIIIAHVFSAIVMTINPVYTYVDDSGITHNYNIYEKDKIPENAKISIQRLNICKNRIDSLTSGQDTLVNEVTGNMNVSPNICSINLMADGNLKSLTDEPGIPELKQLYLDEEYDFSTGKFQGMTDETKKQYKSDLKAFYTVFTGKSEMPDDIKDFSDIKLKNYHNDEKCLNNKFKSSYSGNINNKLFENYANNIKNMIKHANDKQDELLKVINILFTYVVDPQTGDKKIKIHPALNDTTLAMVVKDTRKIIMELYSRCENDYLKGVKLYEDIVNAIGASTLINQEKNLNEALEKVSAPFVPLQSVPLPSVPLASVPLPSEEFKSVTSPTTPIFTPTPPLEFKSVTSPTTPIFTPTPPLEFKSVTSPTTPIFTPLEVLNNDDLKRPQDQRPVEVPDQQPVEVPDQRPVEVLDKQPVEVSDQRPQEVPNDDALKRAQELPKVEPLKAQNNMINPLAQGGRKKRTRRKYKHQKHKRKTKKYNK